MNTNIKKQKKSNENSIQLKAQNTKSLNSSESNLLKPGSQMTLKVQALGFKNVGLAELPNGYTIVIPNTTLGDSVRIQIEKIWSDKQKYATAKVLEFLKRGQPDLVTRVGDVLDVTIEKSGPKGSGLVQLSKNFTLIIPKTKAGDKVRVKINRVKTDYAFAKVMKEKESVMSSSKNNMTQQNGSVKLSLQSEFSSYLEGKNLNETLELGNKLCIKLPETAKIYSNYFVVKLKGSIVFIKMGLGVELGDLVKIKITKVGSTFAVAKLLKVSPLSKTQKQLIAKKRVQKMVQTGLHFGEKAIKCHANMRQFVWIKQKGQNKNRLLIKRGRHLINVLKTRRCLVKALKQLAKYAAKGKTFLFVGTKKSASSLIARTAMLSKTSFFVNTRWLGGMLTNWKTILKSISQIQPILKEKQRIIKSILERRNLIKRRLINKVNLLRKKSQKLMATGKLLMKKIKNSVFENKNQLINRSQKLILKKEQLVERNQLLIKKYTELSIKQQQLIQQSHQIQTKGNALIQNKQSLLKQLKKNQQKLKDFKQLFVIGQELNALKNSSLNQGKTLWTVSYGQLTKFSKQNPSWLVPNPSKEILNQIINAMKTASFEDKSSLTLSNQLTASISNRPKSDVVTSEQTEKSSKTIVLSKLLSKFTSFLPFIKVYIQTLVERIQNIKTMLTNTNENLLSLQTLKEKYEKLNNEINAELGLIKTKLMSEQKNLNRSLTKLKKLASEQRLLKFLPILRYLPTPRNKMSETIQILMKKFVDPKLSYSMDNIYDQKLKFTSKKMAAARKQKWQRLEKYFGGVTKMAKMKKKQISNNVAIIVGQQEEMNAVRECKKLGIKMFTIVDTNCNPRLSDHVIPANDDSRNSVKYILGEMLTYIRLAQKLRKKVGSRKLANYSV
uniref:Small ribosomal subunit protein uS2c n=1 Tax=Pseudomuriella schumacherensis TaxID=889459 RepID=A0A140HB16_PSESB|nr:ribosomal protein S2 [Pseudomuriella schumacherensis]AMO01365.1 ribosomal protein S2 [Pseudomuriella schumacherensis]